MIGWLNDINRLVSKDKREPRVIHAENTHTHTHARSLLRKKKKKFFLNLKTKQSLVCDRAARGGVVSWPRRSASFLSCYL